MPRILAYALLTFGLLLAVIDFKPSWLPASFLIGTTTGTNIDRRLANEKLDDAVKKIDELTAERDEAQSKVKSARESLALTKSDLDSVNEKLSVAEKALLAERKDHAASRVEMRRLGTIEALLKDRVKFANEESDALRVVISSRDDLLKQEEKYSSDLRAEMILVRDESKSCAIDRDKWQGIATRCMTPSPRAQREHKKRCGPLGR